MAAHNIDLPSMTKQELLDFAKEEGINGVRSSMLKANIIATIEEALS